MPSHGSSLPGRVPTGRRLVPKLLLLAVGSWVGCARNFLFAGTCLPQDAHGRKHRTYLAAEEPAQAGLRSFEDLGIGEELTATVKEVQKNGAVVDLGIDKPGWIHIANVRAQKVDKMEDLNWSPGEKLQVRVVKVKKNEVDVASVHKDLEMFSKRAPADFAIGEEVMGRFVSGTGSSVFLDIGAMVDGFLPGEHVVDFDAATQKCSDLFQKGQEVRLKVVSTTPSKITLSMK
ncbi:unnamed protein product [Polarella glacialis]|uniref:S1 motif domain-containing protein n=2 Tax=Polarella glacialis TaxID=89957 RepID=A0A813JMY1_POLGL|nr:unnamed protein product [Polarella glacialis]